MGGSTVGEAISEWAKVQKSFTALFWVLAQDKYLNQNTSTITLQAEYLNTVELNGFSPLHSSFSKLTFPGTSRREAASHCFSQKMPLLLQKSRKKCRSVRKKYKSRSLIKVKYASSHSLVKGKSSLRLQKDTISFPELAVQTNFCTRYMIFVTNIPNQIGGEISDFYDLCSWNSEKNDFCNSSLTQNEGPQLVKKEGNKKVAGKVLFGCKHGVWEEQAWDWERWSRTRVGPIHYIIVLPTTS